MGGVGGVSRPGSSQLVGREESSLGGVFCEALCVKMGTQPEHGVWPAPASEDLRDRPGLRLEPSSWRR